MIRRSVHVEVNGEDVAEEVEPRLLLAHFLRSVAGAKSVRIGCDTTSCGACTALLDGRPVKSCTLFAVQADGRSVQTIESLAGPDGELHPLQEAFWQEHGLQCGYCTAGIVMAAVDIVSSTNVEPTDEEIREAISGNICRCTGYVNIVNAIRRAARTIREAGASADAG